MLAAALAVWGLAIAPTPVVVAVPGVCPPFCDAIPDAAWMAPAAIPLNSVYQWPGLPGLAVTTPAPRFAFEEVCGSLPVPGDARDYSVAAQAAVPKPPGQWQLRVQLLHWRGDTAYSGPIASTVFDTARARLRACQLTAPLASPSITTDDPRRIAAVLSVPGQRLMHQYLLTHPASSTIVELAMWSTPPPQVAWPAVPDTQILDAIGAPLCDAYLGSCR